MAQFGLARTEYIAENTRTRANSRLNPMLVAITAFLLLNALKITLFNDFLVTKPTESIFIYKFVLTLLAVMVIYPIVYKSGSRVVMIVLYVLQALYIVVNIGYYLYFRSYLDVMQIFSLFGEASSLAGNNAVPLHPQMLVAFIDLPVFLFILMGFKSRVNGKVRLGKKVVAVMIASVLIIASIETFNYIHKDSIVNLLQDFMSGETPIVERYGTVANNIVDMIHNSSNQAMYSQLKYGKEQGSSVQTGATAKATDTKPNYIMIQVESMDANIVNTTYKGSYVTPFLHSLESQSIYYPYAMSYHEGGGTSDSEFSVLNSVEPLSTYPALKLSGYDYPNSFVQRLDSASYTTLAFHGNVGSFYNRDVAFPKIGYDSFYDMTKMKLPENGWGVPDDKVMSYAFNKLGTVNGPFFAHIITMTSHEPFNSARHYYNNSLYDDITDKTVKEYYNSFSYVDKSIQDFVTNVEKNYKNTYIIIYGDHTPNIKSSMYTQASFTMDGRYFEFVPMFVITPDGKVRKETNEVASFLDVAPTILQTSGIPYDFRTDGQNLTGNGLETEALPFKGDSYDRALLFKNASATAAH